MFLNIFYCIIFFPGRVAPIRRIYASGRFVRMENNKCTQGFFFSSHLFFPSPVTETLAALAKSAEKMNLLI